MQGDEGQEWEAIAQMVEHFRKHGIGHQAGGWWVEEAGQGGGPVHEPKLRTRALIGWRLLCETGWGAAKTLMDQVPPEDINSMMTHQATDR